MGFPFAKAMKAARLLPRPRFARAAMLEGVAAAVEHLPAIRRTAANSLIDVGANKGQFSLAFRAVRPQATIIAFEPLPDAADKYERLFAGDRHAKLQRAAIGATETAASFHVTDRRDSSSLLKPGAGQREAFGVCEAETIEVAVKPLGRCIDIKALPRPILMKIDVQGAELDVLKGCADLEAVDFIYAELSFVELYEGQPLADEVHAYLKSRGFTLVGEYNRISTRVFGPTQADFLFRRKAAP